MTFSVSKIVVPHYCSWLFLHIMMDGKYFDKSTVHKVLFYYRMKEQKLVFWLFFYKINVLCHSCEWKLKGLKNKMREEFSMLLFLYSRVIEINYTTAISKKVVAIELSRQHIFPKGSLQWKDQCAEKFFL